MSQNNNWFQILPTTGRTADTLARRHGYKNVTDLASSLPSHAEVLDVGTGASPLGRMVAHLRPDIHWINLDFSYHDERILRDVSQDAPSNLMFITGDATKLDHHIEPTSVDAVFSYWLFPHLSLYDRQTALTAAKQLYKAVKPGGILAIGPRKHPMLHPTSLRGGSWVIRKEEGLTADIYSREVLRQTELSSVNRYARTIFDTATFELFGTSRYIKGSGINQQIYNPRTDVYIPWYYPQAMYLVGRLLFGVMGQFVRSQHFGDNGS